MSDRAPSRSSLGGFSSPTGCARGPKNSATIGSCGGCFVLGKGALLRLRIFVSSPGDVGAERGVALAVAERLQFEFRGQIELETYLWESSLLRATDTFQAQIVDIAEADLALFILWARMGTALPQDEFRRPGGSQYTSR